MSLFHSNGEVVPPAPPKPEYTFYNGNPAEVDELFAALQEPKQPFVVPPQQSAPLAEVADLEPADTDKPKSEADRRRAARTPAKFVVGALDGGLAYLSAMIAKADESDSYKASKDDREQLTDLCADYLKDKGADIPPGIMILIMTVVVYAPKLKMAWDDRKQNQIMREQREKLIQQEMDLRALRAQMEQKTLNEKLNTNKK